MELFRGASGGSLGGLWVRLGWFGGSGVGCGPGVVGFGCPWGSMWGPGAVIFLALVCTRSGIHVFPELCHIVINRVTAVWVPKLAVTQGLVQSAAITGAVACANSSPMESV